MTTSPCLPSRLLATPPDLLPRLLTGLMTGVLTGALPVLLGISLLLPAGAQASSVWRCESGGRVTYADQPCDRVTSPSTGGTMAQRSTRERTHRPVAGNWFFRSVQFTLSRFRTPAQTR